MAKYVKRPEPVDAVQWAYDFAGGPYGPLPEGFVQSPPPTDYGCPASAWYAEKKLLIHPGYYVLTHADGHMSVMNKWEFEETYELARP